MAGYSMEEVARSVLLTLQTLTLVKTIIIHFDACLTTTDLILCPDSFVLHGII